MRLGLARLAGGWFRLASIGALALAPLGLTVWIVWLLIQLASFVGGLFSRPLMTWLASRAPEVEALLEAPLAVFVLEVGTAMAILTLVGFFAGNFLGRSVERLIGKIVAAVPVANTIYASAQKLIRSFQSPAEAGQKVVLIEFPSEHMKTVGLVTRQFRASDTGEELAAVYVPTTPNPTSGYVEIVPVERLVWLDWSVSEAIEFIVSAGVSAPERISYRTGGKP